MDIKLLPNEDAEIICPTCKGDVSPAGIIKRGNDVLCKFCLTHLGFIWDLPQRIKEAIFEL